MSIEGSIDSIGVSGRHWIGNEISAFDLVKETLESANSSIRIAIYSFGQKSKELDLIFDILHNKIFSKGVKVQLIINKFWSTTDYAKKKLKQLEHRNFVLLNFEPENENENLHAKIIVVDSKIILVGSANISKSGLFSNHELVIKLSGGEFASRINNLLDILATEIFRKESK